MKRLIFLALLVASALNMGSVLAVNAQTSADAWQEPDNLSNSGGAQSPVGFVDSANQIHLIWNDEFAGWYYTRYSDSQWTQPALVGLPFERSIPTLHYASTDWVHAFLIDERRSLVTNRVKVQSIDDAGSWSEQRVIANPVADYAVAIDGEGIVHLVYIQTEDTNAESANLFYRQSRDQGASWSAAVLLYDTPYFRSLTRETANLHIAASSSETGELVYVVFDNPARKQVVFMSSPDDGETWAPPVEIDRPAEDKVETNPFGIRIGVFQNRVLLIWQNGDPEASCSQFYQVSEDFGVTWSEQKQMLEDLTGCAQDIQILTYNEQYALVATQIQGLIYFQVWDGSRWSQPFIQSEITSFIDPQTLASVMLGCQQYFIMGETQLFLVGCDTADNGDIWVTNREIGTISDWFPAPSIWSGPTLITSSSDTINDLHSTTGKQGRVHLVWSHPEGTVNNPNASAISYLQFDGITWSQSVSVLKSQDGTADQPVLTVNADDQLLISWSNSSAGELYLNSVDAARAVTNSRWSEAVVVPLPHPIAYSPDITVNENGRITLAYAIPLNEDRGVYISQSEDGGNTWSEPILVFNAVTAAWDRVGKVSLAESRDGSLHLLWWRSQLTSEAQAIELYNANSEDGGLTWSEAQILAFQPAVWSTLITTGEKTIHAFWQEDSPLGPSLKHQFSNDGGKTWSQLSDISQIGEQPGKVACITDRFGQIHILRLLDRVDLGSVELQHLRWDGTTWVNETNFNIPLVNLVEITSLAANATDQDQLVVMYSTLEDQLITPEGGRNRSDEITRVRVHNLYSIIRPLDVPSILPTAIPEATAVPTLEPTPTATPTLQIVLSSTPQAENNNPPAQENAGGIAGAGIIIGVGLSIVLVVGAFSAWMFLRKPERNY